MIRTYNIADAKLLEHAGIILEALNTDLQDFEAMDPDLNQPLTVQLKNQYQKALELGGDDMARGRVGVKTQTLLQEMEKASKMMKSLRYWVKKVYEDDAAGQKLFQLSKFWKVRNRQAELVVYLKALVTTVNQQRELLEQASVPAALLDSVTMIANDLEAANTDQESSKSGRQYDTLDRVARLNAIHKTARKFSDAAEFVYEDNIAKRDLYRVPGNSQPSTEDEVTAGL